MPRPGEELVNIQLPNKWGVVRQWLATGPIGGFNAIVTLALIGVGLELFGESLSTAWKILVFIASFLIAVTAYYVQYLRPLALVADQYEQTLMRLLLERLQETYCRNQPGEFDLRVNIMRVRSKWHRFGVKPLQIDYHLGDYDAIELALAFEKGIGCCGWCLEANEQRIYDKDSAHQAAKGLNDVQVKGTEHVRSILSTPVYRPERLEKPIAILNIDSRDSKEQTGFDDPKLRAFVAEYASLIGAYIK